MKKIKLPKGLRRRKPGVLHIPIPGQLLTLLKGRGLGASTMAVES